MRLFKVLLVDDEEDVRQAIVRKLDWQSLGFTVVGEASNGQEALELAEQLQPDVIMTDIKMPFMDGLTFCRRVKELIPGVKVAIFSGFDEFEYAKEAIRLEVEEYILKPINAEELTEIFKNLRASLQREIEESNNIQRLQQHYQESLPLIRQQFFLNLLHRQISKEAAMQKASEYGLAIKADHYCAATISFEKKEEQDINSKNRLTSLSIQQIVDEFLNKKISYYQIYAPDHIVVLFMLFENENLQNVLHQLNQLFIPAKKRLGIHIAIGVGNTYNKLEDISVSYAEACDALEYQILVESGHCVSISDIEPCSHTAGAIEHDFVEKIMRQIKIGTSANLETIVYDFLHYCKKSSPHKQQYQLFFLALSAEILKLIKSYELDAKNPEISQELLEQPANHFSSLDAIGKWLMEYCNKLRVLIRGERKDSAMLLVENAKQKIGKCYTDSNFSQETLCEKLSISPAYFSSVFKKQTGLSFVSYLTNLRMEKALEYLNTTDAKTYEISEKTGYADPNYFSYVFKKHFGIAPSQFRNKQVAKHETQ